MDPVSQANAAAKRTAATIRSFASLDYDAVVAIWRDAAFTIGPSETRDGLALRLERDPQLFLVAELDGEVVGAVMGAFDGRRGWVYHLAVRADHQRLGIGRALLSEVENRLRAIGCIKVNLVVQATNAAVVPFYEAQDYGKDDLIFMGNWLDSPGIPLRRAARVLLVDERDRVLLVRIVDPPTDRTWWTTPGGGLDPNETFEAAARREVAEETGLTDFDLSPCVWTREHRGQFMGQPFHVQERIFFARVNTFEPNTAGFTELERQVQVDWKWWTLAELEATDADFAPRSFARAFGELLADGPSDAPFDVGV